MITGVRTTLVIDDHVLMEAKRHAVETGMTVSELTTLALREALRRRHDLPPQARFSIPTFGAGPRHDTSARQLAEIRDQGR